MKLKLTATLLHTEAQFIAVDARKKQHHFFHSLCLKIAIEESKVLPCMILDENIQFS
jgi:hypothetical protein